MLGWPVEQVLLWLEGELRGLLAEEFGRVPRNFENRISAMA
jgi:hypothetical protein